jgi:hypothetical protein
MYKNQKNYKNRPRKSRKGEKIFETKLEVAPGCQSVPLSVFNSFDQRNKTETDCYTIKMLEETTISSDSSGKWSTTNVVGSNPSSAANWSSMALVFDEYRTLAMTAELVPLDYAGGATATLRAPITGVVDLDSASALTGYTLADQYSSCKEVAGGKRIKIVSLMSGSENSQFQSTAAPTNLWYIKFYSANNSNSIVLGQLRITRWIQFRGKGI